jgi:hypothetical protein
MFRIRRICSRKFFLCVISFAGVGLVLTEAHGGRDDLVEGFVEIFQALRNVLEIRVSGVVTAFSRTAKNAG